MVLPLPGKHNESIGLVQPMDSDDSPKALPNPFIDREGEAPAEPFRSQLGRRLAPPPSVFTKDFEQEDT